MNYQNARKGISKILTAQWIQIICIILMLIGAVTTIVFTFSAGILSDVSADAAGESIMKAGIGGMIVLAALVIGVIAFILNLVGLNTARKDETQFNTAFMICIIGLVVAVLATCLQSVNPIFADWMNFVQKILSLAVIEYVAAGIISIAEKLNNEKVAGLGRKIRMLIMILYIIVLVLNVFGKGTSLLAGYVSIAEVVLELIVFIVYIVLLTKAKNMLA